MKISKPIIGGVVFALIVAAWFQRWSLDGIQGVILAVLLSEDTAYAAGYTDRAFRSLQDGMSEQEVESLLGRPLQVAWSFRPANPTGCLNLHFKDGTVRSWIYDECEKLGVRAGQTTATVEALPGDPVSWVYSESPRDTNYRVRVVDLSDGRVVQVVAQWYLD